MGATRRSCGSLESDAVGIGELTEARSSPCDPLEELRVQLRAMPRLWLLVSLPGSLSRLALLVSRQAFLPDGSECGARGCVSECSTTSYEHISAYSQSSPR